MKVLVISPFLPWPETSGSRIRTMTLLRSLRGHDVYLVAFREPDETEDAGVLSGLCREHRVFTRPLVGRLRTGLNHLSLRPLLSRRFLRRDAGREIGRLVREEKIDGIVAEAVLVGEYARPFRGVRRILDAHNLEFMRARRRRDTTRRPHRRLYYGLIAERLRRYERRVFREFDLGVVCSEQDRRAYESLAPGRRAVVIPNAVDTEAFRPGRRGGAVIFTGTLWYEPNADAARRLAREIFPLMRREVPGLELLIVGASPPADLRALDGTAGVTVAGPVEDIRPWLERGAVFAAPIRTGSGTRQKILDAMAAGLPVVASAQGAEGLEAVDGSDICLAEDPAEFASAALRLLKDPGYAARIAAGGRRLVEARYSRAAAEDVWRSLWRAWEAVPARP